MTEHFPKDGIAKRFASRKAQTKSHPSDPNWDYIFSLIAQVKPPVLQDQLIEEIQELHSFYEPNSPYVKGDQKEIEKLQSSIPFKGPGKANIPFKAPGA